MSKREIVTQTVKDLYFENESAEEVFKYHALTLTEDFNVPVSYVVDMVSDLYVAMAAEQGKLN